MSHATSPGVQSCCEVFGSLFLSPGWSRDMLRVSAQSLFLVCAGHCLKRWEFISDEDPALAFQGFSVEIWALRTCVLFWELREGTSEPASLAESENVRKLPGWGV